MATCREDVWMQTVSGKQFFPYDPCVDDICIEDIAYALSTKNRFGGHAKPILSVAQHSVLCCDYCPENPLEALLHDASESYMPDVHGELKQFMPDMLELEAILRQAIAARFGLLPNVPPEVKVVDKQLLATEKRDVMGKPPVPWLNLQGVRALGHIYPWSQQYAEEAFLRRFKKHCKDVSDG